MTRYESIKNKSIEEMAAFLRDLDVENISVELNYCKNYCPKYGSCDLDIMDPDDCYDDDYKDAIKVWLSQEV